MAARRVFLITGVITLAVIHIAAGQYCKVPEHFWGDFYSIDQGVEIDTLINADGLQNKYLDDARCKDMKPDNSSIDAQGRFSAHVLFHDTVADCYQCQLLYFRSPNILQFKQSTCQSFTGGEVPTLDRVCSDIGPSTGVVTMFKKTLTTVNCKNTFEGTYTFTYEVNYGGGGICTSDRSAVVACQEPGSPYVDNQVFNMFFGKCPDVSQSSNRKIRFQCMGTWRGEDGNVYAGIADLGEEIFRERFRCLLTRTGQQLSDNTIRYTMSRWADCSSLKSPYEGPIRLQLLPAIYGTQVIEPSCNLPKNFTGSWFMVDEFDTDVRINATHIYYKTKLDQFTYRETVFTCQQTRDSRYLMTAVTVGKCEVDYICFDFLPRHHNIVRWRMARPYRMTTDEMAQPDYLERKFRQACTWQSFTIDRNDIAWKYNTYILNPPAPVDCPIGGRYQFQQIGNEEEKYNTRIRGITERPRHMISDCKEYVTEFKSCDNNPKKLLVDAEYCATVDHTGRPVGEYDIADREINCVGYWMEDMRSYLITYDEEDAVSPFRCWVYERLDWRDIVISRATRGRCGREQTAFSYTSEKGASLHMVLKESERLFDSCPQRFDTGEDPYTKELKVFVLAGSPGIHATMATSVLATVCVLILIH